LLQTQNKIGKTKTHKHTFTVRNNLVLLSQSRSTQVNCSFCYHKCFSYTQYKRLYNDKCHRFC